MRFMSNYRTCAFCLKNDSRPSREDVFAKWIAREFPGDEAWSAFEYETGQLRGKSRKIVGLICKRVCERCNYGWMSKLEDKAKPILLPLMHARKTTLSADDQLLLARWFIKTANTYDLTAKRKRECYFTADERHSLMNSLSLPPDTGIFIAQYRGTIGNIIALESHMAPTRETLPKEHEQLLDTHGYAGTFVIKHLALQVFSFRRGDSLTGKRLDFMTPTRWAGAAVQIWPIRNIVNWPPRLLLDDAGLKAFAGRWTDMGLLVR